MPGKRSLLDEWGNLVFPAADPEAFRAWIRDGCYIPLPVLRKRDFPPDVLELIRALADAQRKEMIACYAPRAAEEAFKSQRKISEETRHSLVIILQFKGMDTMLIQTLHIKNFKLLQDVNLEPGNINVIIGPNGAGKTSILEAIGLLSLAMTDRIDDLSLQRKGIRLSTSSLLKSSLKNYKKSPLIGLQMDWKDDAKYSYSVNLNTPSETHEWKYHSEALYVNEKKEWGQSGHSKERYDNSIGLFMLEPNESLEKARPSVEWIRNYAIYQPSTPVLRGVLSDSAQLTPLGLNGGRLAEALGEIISEKKENQDEEDFVQDELLELIEWADDLSISSPNKSNIHSSVPASRRVIEFHDRFMKETDRFTAYDASEGALYILFLACLALHPKAPRIFAVDNFDQAMNPRLAMAVTRKFCEMALKMDKIIFLTTHNPLALDGLDLNDSRIRLFTTERSRKTGEVKIHRVKVDQALLETEMPLSRLWTSGMIGGVPNL